MDYYLKKSYQLRSDQNWISQKPSSVQHSWDQIINQVSESDIFWAQDINEQEKHPKSFAVTDRYLELKNISFIRVSEWKEIKYCTSMVFTHPHSSHLTVHWGHGMLIFTDSWWPLSLKLPFPTCFFDCWTHTAQCVQLKKLKGKLAGVYKRLIVFEYWKTLRKAIKSKKILKFGRWPNLGGRTEITERDAWTLGCFAFQ